MKPLNDSPIVRLVPPDHRHTFHHTHHPLSTHLPPQRFRKRALSMERRRRKKRRKKKTSVPPSEVTPTIHEVDEEEAASEAEGPGQGATPALTSTEEIQVITDAMISLQFRESLYIVCV